MYAKAIRFRESIVIYYCHQRKTLRLATGINNIPFEEKIKKDSSIDDKYFKNGMLTAKVNGYEEKNKIIAVKLQQVTDIISGFFFANQTKPSVAFINTALKWKTRVN